jgi:hypothetical protein
MKELTEVCAKYKLIAYNAQQFSRCPPGYLISDPEDPTHWLGFISLSESTDPVLVESKIVKWLLDSGFG